MIDSLLVFTFKPLGLVFTLLMKLAVDPHFWFHYSPVSFILRYGLGSC
jgi:hypothetical protein